LPIT